MEIIVFIFLNGWILVSSHLAAHRYLRESRLSEHLVTTFLLYVVQVTVSILFLGVIVKNSGTVALTLFNAAVSSAVIFLLRKEIRNSFKTLYKKWSGFLGFLGESKDYVLYFFLFLFVFQAAATLVKIYYLPPHVGDVFAYHLHPVVEWFQRGEITLLTDTPVTRVNRNPLGTKFLHLWFITFFESVTWIELPQFLFGIMLSVSSYAVMLKANIKRVIALRFGVLIYFIPAVLLQSRTCQDHLILAACTMTVLLYFIDTVYNGKYDRLVFLALGLAFLIGIKKHSLLIPAVLLPALLLSRGFNRGKLAEFIKANRLRLIIGAGILVLSGRYFYFRNPEMTDKFLRLLRLHYKNILLKLVLPLILLTGLVLLLRWLYREFGVRERLKRHGAIIPAIGIILALPAGYAAMKNGDLLKPFFSGETTPIMLTNRSFDSQYPAFKSDLAKNILAFPFRIKDIGMYTSYTPDLLEKSGFGVQFFGLGLIAYLIAVFSWVFKRAFRDSVMGFLTVFAMLLLLCYFLFYFTWANYRSFMFFAVIGLILWAYLQSKWGFNRPCSRFIDGLLIVMILFNIGTCFFEGNMAPDQWKTMFTMTNRAERSSVKYSSLIRQQQDKGKSWGFIDNYIEPGQPIGFSGGGDAWTFPYFDHHMKRKIHSIKHLPGFAVKREIRKGIKYRMLQFTPLFMEQLKQRNIRYIHFSTQGTPQREKVFVPEGTKEVFKITPHLYYVKW
ncbi:MAG: hypothetical protein GY940_03045 [bacterium]|nr:hypothetical protein [bacterium]